jgi:hypothetical protein
MSINPYKAGRAVGKGVRYLTSLGSKIGKSLGSSVDKLGAGTRNAQASVIKGARGARDAANAAGAAARRGVKDARAGYDAGRRGSLHLDDLNETPAQKYFHGKMAESGKANFIQPKAPNRDKYIKANKSVGSPGTNGKNWAIPVNRPKTTKDGKAVWANGDKMPKPSSGVKKLPSLNEWMNTKGKGMIRNPMMMPGNKPKGVTPTGGMSKNRRAGIITGASIAAGYGVHRGNDALQNHYRQQKNAARGR